MSTTFKNKSSNPAFRWADYDAEGRVAPAEGVTSLGVTLKTFFYIAIMCATGTWAWMETWGYSSVEGTAITQLPAHLWSGVIAALVVGFVISLVTIFVPRIAPWSTPFYAACEGVVLGAISAAFEAAMPGIVLNTVLSTLGVFLTVAFLYGTGIIVVNNTFKVVLLSAMVGILVMYLVDICLMAFSGYRMPMLHEAGNIWAILISLAIIVVAGLNFAWDFENVKEAQAQGAPKYYEAYLAFGFLLTLVWLYLECLRLWALVQGKK